jgi:radical SAM family uncharacterized protein
VDPVELILRRVARPGRYAGGEYGSVGATAGSPYRVAISYPDLYEIGMSNLAVRILYRLINAVPGVVCERVFAPDTDLESQLRASSQPLFTLESRSPLSEMDLVGFSLGYEMTLTNMLAILDLGGVPVDAGERGVRDPIVIAGGPVVSNPLPPSRFVDCVFVGEAEEWVGEALPLLAGIKGKGGDRGQQLEALLTHRCVWAPSKAERVKRAVWTGFGTTPESTVLPVASLKIVQDHGNVEIMRGCPNGCRFCHAGMFTRPARIKEPADIVAEVAGVLDVGGHHEVTLASLSSADYPDLPVLIQTLNALYSPRRVSFSVPSLKVESVGLDLFAAIAAVRRSGLTFALETPGCLRQRGLNKEVPVETTIAILREARARGWRSAKFYFMVGLPLPGGENEAADIVELLEHVGRETGLFLTVNVATFIPKPHTPFQWARQLGESEALDTIMQVRHGLPKGRFKVGYHAPFTSVLEGMVSRGDARAGDVVLAAYRAGARLDAWEERVRWDIWREAIAGAGWDALGEATRARALDEQLPWHVVDPGVSQRFLKEEWARAQTGEMTRPCDLSCTTPCGSCGPGYGRVRRVPSRAAEVAPASAGARPGNEPPAGRRARVLFRFRKQGRAVHLSHLDLLGVMEKALARSGLRAAWSEGHNPQPRLEFASPLALGVESLAEIAAVDLVNHGDAADFVQRLNRAFPQGLQVDAAVEMPEGQRRSLAARYWGADYEVMSPRAAAIFGALAGGASPEGPVTAVSLDGEIVRVRHRHLQRKNTSLLSLIETAIGVAPLAAGVTVRRVRLLGLDEKDYYEAFAGGGDAAIGRP